MTKTTTLEPATEGAYWEIQPARRTSYHSIDKTLTELQQIFRYTYCHPEHTFFMTLLFHTSQLELNCQVAQFLTSPHPPANIVLDRLYAFLMLELKDLDVAFTDYRTNALPHPQELIQFREGLHAKDNNQGPSIERTTGTLTLQHPPSPRPPASTAI